MKLNLFSGMTDDKLEECYRQYIGIQIKKDTLENEPLSIVLDKYKIEIGVKYSHVVSAIMYNQMFVEIARRWCECRL